VKCGNDEVTKAANESLKGSEGIPLGIQVSTKSNEEEKCLGIMSRIDLCIKRYHQN